MEKQQKIEKHVKGILKEIEGKNYEREGLLNTPTRVAKAYDKLFSGYGQSVEDCITFFENENSGRIDQIIGLSGIEFYSMCEHHILPFFGKAHIYYIPGKKIVGISKLARILDIYARRLQNQERITKQVADSLSKYLKPRGVAVIVEAEHLCMKSRGVEKQYSVMRTSELRGAFRDEGETREELFNLIKLNNNSNNG